MVQRRNELQLYTTNMNVFYKYNVDWKAVRHKRVQMLMIPFIQS